MFILAQSALPLPELLPLALPLGDQPLLPLALPLGMEPLSTTIAADSHNWFTGCQPLVGGVPLQGPSQCAWNKGVSSGIAHDEPEDEPAGQPAAVTETSRHTSSESLFSHRKAKLRIGLASTVEAAPGGRYGVY